MKRILLNLIALMLVTSVAWAQERTVTGKVTSGEDGSGLPGVNVIIKGTATGTTSDIEGNFKITVPEGATLQFSAIGFTAQEVVVGARSVIDITLETDVKQLSEVVVTGYSTVKRSDLTSAISTVKGESIQSQPIASIDNLLQGKSPGVQVVAQNGAPGSAAYIRIRGVGSINASNEPLFIVDGVQLTQAQYSAINPNDILEINILKDAASTSIYGSRASNGVVLVSTKKGSEASKPSVTYKFQIGTKEMIPLNFDLMNKTQKLDYEVASGLRSPESADALRTSPAAPETDWLDVLLRRGQVQSHDLSFSGKSESAKYFFSFAKYDEQGITQSSDFGRITGRANTEFNLTKWLAFGESVTFSHSKDNRLRDRYNAQNPFYAMLAYNPYEPEFALDPEGNKQYDENGQVIYNLTRQGFSISEALVNNPAETRFSNALGNVYANINPIKGLNLRSTLGLSYNGRAREAYTKPGSVLDGYVGDPNAPGSKTDNLDNRFQYNWTNTANYSISPIDGHNLDILVGTEFIKADIRTSFISSKGFPSGKFVTHDNASAVLDASTTRDQWSIWSQFGQLSYGINEKYFATASIRRDGSSRFGANNKFGYFWATSVGWNIHNESFMDGVELFDQLKLRGSVGTSGNVPNELYASRGFYGFGSYNNQTSAVPTQLENKDLKWEENLSYSIGLDFGILNNRISGALDYYTKNTKDLLFDRPISRTTGFDTRLENIGEIVNKGLELELAGDVIRGDQFNLRLLGSIATNSNEVLALKNGGEDIINANSGITLLREGSKVHTFYLVRYAGVNPANGEELFLTKDGAVTNVWNGDDAVALKGKTPLPTYFGSFGLEASYKGLTLSTSFYYQGGNYSYNQAFNQDLLGDGSSANSRGSQRVDALNYWKKPGDTGVLPKPNVTNNPQTTDRYLQRADYIRLRNLNLAYNLPKPLISKAKLQSVQVFVQGTNLWTFNPFFDGDPEVGRGSDESALTLLGEITLYTYPNTRGYTAGINVTF